MASDHLLKRLRKGEIGSHEKVTFCQDVGMSMRLFSSGGRL